MSQARPPSAKPRAVAAAVGPEKSGGCFIAKVRYLDEPALIQEAFVAHNVIPFAGEDRMPIDDGDHAIEHLRR